MRLVLFGANGSAGSCIAQEALNRGHQVSAVVRDSSRFTMHISPLW
jgi:putative NADH-flavin reductase